MYSELVKALRNDSSDETYFMPLAADTIESLTAENAEKDATIATLQSELSKLREENRWIPVSERLPRDITNKVNVLCKNGYVGFGHYEKYRETAIWYNLESQKPFTDWDLEDCETYEVTHWREPQPPSTAEVSKDE